MRIILYIMLVLSVIGVSSCKEVRPDPVEHPKSQTNDSTRKFDVIWSHQTPDGFMVIDAILEYNNSVIMMIWKGFSSPATITSFEKTTGDTLWSVDVANSTSGFPNFYLNKDRLIIEEGSRIKCLSASKGSLIWDIEEYPGARNNTGLSLTGDRLFVGYQVGDKWNNDSCLLFEIDPNSGERTHILTISASDFEGYSPSIQISKLYRHRNGDEILVFQNRGLNWNTIRNRFDILAYNLTADSMYWTVKLVNDISSGSQAPLLIDDLFVARGEGKLFGYDVPTGKLVWEQSASVPETGINSSNILYHKDKIIANPGNQGIINIFRVSDGGIYATERNAGSPMYDMATDGEYIYYTDLVELWCHDINAASFQWKAESPFEDGNFSGALWVDPESRNIFISDKKRIMCLKVNK